MADHAYNAQMPAPQELEAVEATLYNRMLRNAFIGFVKSSAIAAVIGLAVGGGLAILAKVVDVPLLGEIASKGIVSGALRMAGLFAGIAGSFGAVAGIQSTRDTRRFFLMHEGPGLSSEDTTANALVVQPLRPKEPEVTSASDGLVCDHVEKLLAKRDAQQAQLLHGEHPR